jgi:hypothetical protein
MDTESVYIETSIVSYLAARPSRDPAILRNQQLTREWWATRQRYRLHTSNIVTEEASAGDSEVAQRRLTLLATLDLLDPVDEVARLSASICEALRFTSRAVADASHIAFAAVYQIDYVLTWNCKHIANPTLWPRLERICRLHEVRLPVLCTPTKLLGGE